MKEFGIICFLSGIIWILYVFAGYPLILMVLLLFRRIQPRRNQDSVPFVSVLISARNEERDIAWKIAETLDLDYPADRLELLVASDASEDRTDDILAGIRDPRLKWLRMRRRGGKGRALNKLVQRARGELLFFTDANAHVEKRSLRRMARHFQDERVGCVTGDSHSISEIEHAAISDGASVYWGYESYLRRLESGIGSVLVCDGAIFCMRRKLYTPLAPDLANDLELPMRIGELGYWILHEPQAVVWEHDTSSPSEEANRRRRICAQGALGMWKLGHTIHGIRGWQFLTHKVLRWLTLIPLGLVLVGTLFLVDNPVFAGMLALQAIFYLCAATVWLLNRSGRRAGRLFSVPFYVLLGAWGTLCGVLDACRGRRFDIWEIPSQSRGRAMAATHGNFQ
jgi:cellulose synthase/poly-beta-1,6-N-acetylglucosamine synthase-like glycosyltransferase